MEKEEIIQAENPVPLSDAETAEEFNRAITKARLLYDYIEVSKESQCAILSESDERREKDYVLLYTSEIDRKLHTKTVRYSKVSQSRFKGDIKLKDGFYFIYKNNKKQNHSIHQTDLRGIISHNGRVIIEPIYMSVFDIQNGYIMACEPAILHGGKIIDYNGNLILSYDEDTMLSEQVICAGDTDDKDEQIDVLIGRKDLDDNTPSKTRHYTVHFIYKGQMYYLAEQITSMRSIGVTQNRIVMRKYESKKFALHLEAQDILRHGIKMQYGDKFKPRSLGELVQGVYDDIR